jgi:hypothetical protein
MPPLIPIEFAPENERNFARLQERHRRIIDGNIDLLANRRIIDLACSNGRWSYASVVAGAKFVIGVEGREEKAQEAEAILKKLEVEERYRFEVGDIFDWLYLNREEPADTILCLGVYYHIMDHYRLLTLMAKTSASAIIIDSGFVRSFRNGVHVHMEDPDAHWNALPRFSGQQVEFAGFVSIGLMIQMAWNVGFNCRPILWDPKEVTDKKAVSDYMMGRRFTLRLERTGEHFDKDWRESWYKALVTLDAKFAKLFDRKTHDRVVDEWVSQPFKSMHFSVL